jgi:hypothetical protein
MKGFDDLFRETLREYGNKFVSVLRVFLLFYLLPIVVLATIFSVIFISLLGSAAFYNNIPELISKPLNTIWALAGSIAPLIVLIVVLYLGLIIFTFFMSISYIYIGFSKKKSVGVKEAFNQGVKKYFWKYFGFVFVVGFFLTLLFLLLVIPGIIFMVYWIFGVYVLIAEKKGIMDSLRRSREIVKGNWWRVFGFFLLIIVIAGVVSSIASFIPLLGLFSSLIITPFIIFFIKNMYLDMAASKKAASDRAKRR